MKDHPRFKITSKQLIFSIIGCTVGTGILSLPRVASADAKQDAWIAIILGVFVPFVSLFLMERLGRRFPRFTIIEITHFLLGKFIGSVVIIIFITYLILFEGIVLRNSIEITKMYSLIKTPIWVIGIMLIISIIYIAAKGVKVIGRLNELLFYLILFNFVMIFPALSMSDYTNLLPVTGVELKGIIKGSVYTAFAYQGIEILFIVYPMVTRKDEILKAGMTALFIIMFFYVIVTVIGLMVFSTEGLQALLWPSLAILKLLDFPVIERLEIFFLASWSVLVTRPIFNMCFTASFSLTQLFKLDIDKFYPISVFIVGMLIYTVSLIPQNIVENFKFADYVGYAFLVISIGYPLLLHLVAFLRKGKVKQLC